ncbi:hypothetical protein pEaSNUABM40_00133 [Erwinia phage pEa_SNUABM_40]|uniref:Uncharacterized protein n=1 Tax=Erwinia phage pEa_SNUABM_3 TaxID=2869552 RepID=A0AAE7XJU9_9CAUD|nr:hypothetical protein MPK68_gp132 [Erwinia phage pEa_SNUABM_3]QZE56668.1 hypothetical protein pEaSNUABM20_00132 [Erwinia phage pEa_SNUABM_20]QZE58349.1 hypothetical protein pEaSNUABM40_00133 [Erwinia phage pEa_SNUABM_40]UAW52913.1 hypothetical protein pEaSNUABM23_00131 [Erwinia phage pEa_SNUABM_23]UIW10809.1 hypothetical protein pEaSNUABM23_00131 [Erwinia phage pEa_SNUABM_31]QZE56329.1 hypothetical protein pEaSNUABM3_00132 [Erwinia phage pEa_SNUABM_3]
MLEIYVPSGRTDVRIDQITANAMSSLFNAQKHKLPELFVDTLQRFTNVKIREMYLEDFRYMLAMFDRNSWPQSHRLYEWRCTQPFFVDMRGERYYDRPHGRKFLEVDCNMLNTEEVMRQKILTHKWRELPKGLRHPTVQRWVEAELLAETHNRTQVMNAMYIDSDVPLEQTLEYTDPVELIEAGNYVFVSCELETTHKCNRCFRTYTYRTPIDILGYFRVFSDTSMMNMTLDLASAKGIYVPDDITINKLLYWHSAYVHDKNKAEEQRALALAAQRGRRGG